MDFSHVVEDNAGDDDVEVGEDDRHDHGDEEGPPGVVHEERADVRHRDLSEHRDGCGRVDRGCG